MFNELPRLGGGVGVPKIIQIKPDESEMEFLSNEQIKFLLNECENSNVSNLLLIVKIELSTGARGVEIVKLKLSSITPYKITYTKTKEHRNRTVPTTKELYDLIFIGGYKYIHDLF